MATREGNVVEWKARGNSLYLAGDFVGAVEAFRCAVDLIDQVKTAACQVGAIVNLQDLYGFVNFQ